MSKRNLRRNVHGILLLDKRLGVSSNLALQEVKRLLNAAKAGHTGSLDPLATGLLPLCFGEATKVSGMMLDDDKRYRVVIRLGVLTDTGDAEGAVLETKPVPEITSAMLDECLQRFTGEIDQVPPMYSALKLNGKKLYELAREGKTVERKARRITIYELKLLDFERDRLTLEVFCSKGTYIRSLAEDIGVHFGCGGAVEELRRLQAGVFTLDRAYTIEQLRAMDSQQLDACLLNVDEPLQALQAVELQDYDAVKIRNGQAVWAELAQSGPVRLYHAGAFLGLGEMRLDGKLAPCRLFNLEGSS
ncbi:tRNA pseudouridine(55) synthase TruB [Candidatus Methylomicrobium oryzae]|jgi:tRNA pseudouridine55 synthase|uniref:tRNA pseudouridine(55) synthase TruB n=1 Tax=Candidatus Methylomicrobium oryzae TaxID=2802053 RepID=UPI0019218FFA|nr:tRNA pseudouridine(55) synthase TruB [Methylomicrobium sp. RS1]MBL1262350.1 tRNA pseudouridine(55) synthase TruB [Methylomicrobium sp. RS1]